MLVLLCKLWPYLAGGLIGWLLSGWFARRLKYGPAPVEKIVEKKVTVQKVVDNPEHLSLISSLKADNAQIGNLKSRISTFESAKPKVVEKIVEKEIIKEVDNPLHMSRIKALEEENSSIVGFRSKISELENRKPEVVEKIVEKEVVKQVDNPQHLSRIRMLEQENSSISGFKSRITELENRKPEVVEKIVEKEVIKEIDNPQHLTRISLLEDENSKISGFRSRIGDLEGEIEGWKRGPRIDVPAARAAGITIKAEDDFTAIEGIGPKINELIHADGINTFAELSRVEPARIQGILNKAGSNFQMANPGTWPDQANLASNNRWPALKALQDILDGGVYPDANASSGGSGGGTQTVDNPEHVARISDLENQLEAMNRGPAVDVGMARSAGFNYRAKGNSNHVDFTVVEGIGPKIDELIHAAGTHTYRELSVTDPGDIQKILDAAGPNFKLAKPGTWPAQSGLAASNQWEALKAWQDILDGGEE